MHHSSGDDAPSSAVKLHFWSGVCSQRPATPNDLNLAPEQELLFTELIMDGRILEDNLKRMGLDLAWLTKQLEQSHIHSAEDVFLALCDRNLKFVLYKK